MRYLFFIIIYSEKWKYYASEKYIVKVIQFFQYSVFANLALET